SLQQSLTSRVKRVLEENEQLSQNLNDICKQLDVSERTLRRKLSEEGANFQAILNEVRFTRARKLLLQHYKLEDIASRLGYSEAGNFSHAFKRWSGMSPKQYKLMQAHRLNDYRTESPDQ